MYSQVPGLIFRGLNQQSKKKTQISISVSSCPSYPDGEGPSCSGGERPSCPPGLLHLMNHGKFWHFDFCSHTVPPDMNMTWKICMRCSEQWKTLNVSLEWWILRGNSVEKNLINTNPSDGIHYRSNGATDFLDTTKPLCYMWCDEWFGWGKKQYYTE